MKTDRELLNILATKCFPTGMHQLVSDEEKLEGCVHEMSHLADILGEPRLHWEPSRFEVNRIVKAYHGFDFGIDHNEVTASAATWLVIERAGLLSESLKRHIRTSMAANLHFLKRSFETEESWRKKLQTKRVQRTADIVFHELKMWGVIYE